MRDRPWQRAVVAIHEKVVKTYEPWSTEDTRFLCLALGGEVGELQNLVKKEWRGDINTTESLFPWREELAEELADVRIYLELLAEGFGIDLDEVCRKKITKLVERWPETKAVVENAMHE